MSFPGPPTPGQVPQPFQGAPTPGQQPMSPQPQQAQLTGSEYLGSPIPGQQQMQPYGQQTMVPQQQQQWQYPGSPMIQQQQQAATTTQTTTTATSLRYSVQQQTPYLYASTPQPVQYQYPQTQQALQYGSLNSVAAFGQQQQAPQTPQPVQYGSGSQAQSSSSQAMTTQQQAPPAPPTLAPNYNHLYKSPAPATPAPVPAATTTTTSNTTTQTLQYQGSTTGGQFHQVAASQGQTQQFETQVQTLITSLGVCPRNFGWYHAEKGYICAGGNHFTEYSEIDKWQQQPRHKPKVQLVNTWNDPDAPFDPYIGVCHAEAVHPPEVDRWQLMHKQHRLFIAQAKMRGMGAPRESRCRCIDDAGIPIVTEEEKQHTDAENERLKMRGSTVGNAYGFGRWG
ncbi:hypothetical protein LTR97_007605 [Elasticomyces elasticus]|uniref:Uncharacterized protein n=1 Tax=Elasticomyces elasticus TaxID=574655 RepID=A0AAN7W3G2_9PEZI|nr:hypothetical protein LTR97_007605 [Elasticomyces elasticus]